MDINHTLAYLIYNMLVHLFLLTILIVLNLIPDRVVDRKRFILPLSFLLILLYWALRYDYGLDYWDYYSSFYDGTEGKLHRGFGERGYYAFSGLFNKFYQVIIAQSIIVMASLFHLVRKYIPPQCYWLFFLLFFLTPRFHFVMISALRNSLSACVLFWAFDYCYIEKKRWILFALLVFLASLIHTTAIVFFLFPIYHLFSSRLKGKAVFIGLIVLDILSLFFVNALFQYVISASSLTETYDSYLETIGESSIFGVMVKSIVLIPVFYFCTVFDKLKVHTKERKIFLLAFFFLAIELFGFNFGGRFTLYLFIFFIISLTITYQYYKKERFFLLIPYLLLVLFTFYNYYIRLSTELFFNEGNYLFYHTIFEVSPLP